MKTILASRWWVAALTQAVFAVVALALTHPLETSPQAQFTQEFARPSRGDILSPVLPTELRRGQHILSGRAAMGLQARGKQPMVSFLKFHKVAGATMATIFRSACPEQVMLSHLTRGVYTRALSHITSNLLVLAY